MKKLSALMLFALVMTVAPQGSLAEESFRTEIEFGYTYLEGDFGAKADIYRSAGRYHFMPVVTTGWPASHYMHEKVELSRCCPACPFRGHRSQPLPPAPSSHSLMTSFRR